MRLLYRFFVLAIAAALLVVHTRLYLPSVSDYGPDRVGSDLLPQLAFVKGQLENVAGERMQDLFPEGYFFSHALYGLAWVEVGLREGEGSPRRVEAIAEARWALARLDSDAGRAPFAPGLDPPFGVFYVGWSNWLRGGILSLQPPPLRDPGELSRFAADCAALAAAFDRSATPFLSAYPGQSWPVDSVVGAAALRLHDAILPSRFGPTLARWQAAARARLDPATGLLPHRADPSDGSPIEGARGSSQSIIARFLVEIDPTWGREQYARFRQQFIATPLGVPGVREYPLGHDGPGDADSGPLLFGVSLSASVVTLGAAFVQGDRGLAGPLLHAGEALGVPITFAGEKRYAGGLLPVGDAFLAWAKTARPHIAPLATTALPAVVSPWWRIPLHGGAIALLALLSLPLVRVQRRPFSSNLL